MPVNIKREISTDPGCGGVSRQKNTVIDDFDETWKESKLIGIFLLLEDHCYEKTT